MDDRNPFENVRSATILKPGDRVLIEMIEHATPEQVHNLADQIKERFPDVDFAFVSGVNSVYVAPARTP